MTMGLPGESAADLPWSAAGADGRAFLSTTSSLDHDLDEYLGVHAAPRDSGYASATAPSMLEASVPVITAAIVLAAVSTASATASRAPDSES
jgi:hypothetical protein